MTDAASQTEATVKRSACPLALAAVPVLALGALLATQAAGICVSQQRYWTDEELIAVAVKAQASENVRDLQGRTWMRMAIPSTSEAAQDFLRENPRCCSVDRSPDYRGFLDALTGWNAPEVQLNYERNREDPHWPLERYYTQYVAVSTCGEVLKQTKGIGSQMRGYAK